MNKSYIKREYLNLPMDLDYGLNIFLGFKKSKIITLSLREAGNILVSTAPGYSKANIVRNILESIQKDKNIHIDILDEKGIDYGDLNSTNISIYKDESIIEQIRELYTKVKEGLVKPIDYPGVIILNGLNTELLEINDALGKLYYILANANAAGYYCIVSTSSNLLDMVPTNNISKYFKTLIVARTPIPLLRGLFQSKMMFVEPGTIYVKFEDAKPFKCHIPLTGFNNKKEGN